MFGRLLQCVFMVALVHWLGALNIASGDEWPQWRGPQRDGTLTADAWPARLDERHLQVRWRVELSPSYSGPIVADGKVFVTETRDEQHEVVTALKASSGEIVWETIWDGAMQVPFFARANGSWIRSTPAYDSGRLFVGGMRDLLVALDTDNGEILWKFDFVERLKSPLPSFGLVCSPLVDSGFVYAQAGGGVVKLRASTGEFIWRALEDGGGMDGSAFSSPILATLGGRRQLLVQTRTTLVGLDPETGETLWSQEIPAFRGMNILTPTTFGDSVFTSSYGGRCFAFRIDLQEDGFTAIEQWTNKVQGYMSSPLVLGNHVYLHLRNQRFASLDLSSGETNWITTPFGKYWSMIANGDRVLALDERGLLLLIDAQPEEFVLLDSRQVSETETWAHLAVAGNQIFVRSLSELVALDWN